MTRIFKPFYALVISALIITSCSPAKAAKYGVAAIDTQDSSYRVLAVHENGERLVAMTKSDSSGNVTAVTGAVWYSPKGDAFIVQNNMDGLPERINVGNFTIILSNYTSNTVDAAIVSSTGEIEIVKNVSVNSDELLELESLQNQGASVKGTFKLASPILADRKSISRTLRLASFTISVAGCVVAGILSTALTFGTALAVLAIPCGSAIVSGIQLLTEKEDDVALNSTSKALGAIGCGSGSVGDCAGLILDTTADIISATDNSYKEQEVEIENAKMSLILIGEWSMTWNWEDTYNGTLTFHEDNTVSACPDGEECRTGSWTTSGNTIILDFSASRNDCYATYTGTINDNTVSGTNVTTCESGGTGQWSAVKTK